MTSNKWAMTLAEWQRLDKDPQNMIINASVQDGSDSLTDWPIGMCINYADVPASEEIPLQHGTHEHLVHARFTNTTDKHRRANHPITRVRIAETLQHNGFTVNVNTVPARQYFQELASHKFIISPEGNGIDCHRHYEALMAGSIPIVESNPAIIDKYGPSIPILYTTDYSEITPALLLDTYDQMLRTQYDFSRLMLETYDHGTQERIKSNGRYWLKRCRKRAMY